MASDTNQHPLSGCEGKVQYMSWARAAQDARWSKRERGLHLDPYHCHFCGYVHLGRPTFRQRRRLKEIGGAA